MFKATARLYDKAHKVIAEIYGAGRHSYSRVRRGDQKLVDEVSPGRLRLIEWSSIETVVTRVEE